MVRPSTAWLGACESEATVAVTSGRGWSAFDRPGDGLLRFAHFRARGAKRRRLGVGVAHKPLRDPCRGSAACCGPVRRQLLDLPETGERPDRCFLFSQSRSAALRLESGYEGRRAGCKTIRRAPSDEASSSIRDQMISSRNRTSSRAMSQIHPRRPQACFVPCAQSASNRSSGAMTSTSRSLNRMRRRRFHNAS